MSGDNEEDGYHANVHVILLDITDITFIYTKDEGEVMWCDVNEYNLMQCGVLKIIRDIISELIRVID